MGKPFSELSATAQSSIVDAFLGHPDTNLPEPIKDEIREWAAPDQREIEQAIEDAKANSQCEFDLSQAQCEKCGDNRAGEACYFISDGGYEPRDGTYLCASCLPKLFLS